MLSPPGQDLFISKYSRFSPERVMPKLGRVQRRLSQDHRETQRVAGSCQLGELGRTLMTPSPQPRPSPFAGGFLCHSCPRVCRKGQQSKVPTHSEDKLLGGDIILPALFLLFQPYDSDSQLNSPHVVIISEDLGCFLHIAQPRNILLQVRHSLHTF